ncbi:MAG: AEC family transporter [Rhodobacter sp.]|nr:AEC family transporter [Paracoccaceae bacterium]MCC0077744.1 AEC family transporter [Rhodobacter sp.]
MQALIDVILPVFLVVTAGYGVVWRGWMSEPAIDGLMKFAQSFAIPVMLFLAIWQLNLGQVFDWRLLVAYYAGAISGFLAGLFGAHYLFNRDWEDAVAVGFVGLFSNAVLLGLAITERAYGPDALAGNYAIVSLNAPICYLIGVVTMEGVRARGAGLGTTAAKVVKGMVSNPLVIGLGLGALANLTQPPLPGAVVDALSLIGRAGLPAALFALGGILYRYRPEGDLRLIAYMVAIALLLHPAITWVLGRLLGVEAGHFRSGVVTAAMAPGVNAYLFANMYGRAKRVAASTVLVATVLCVLTAWGWMALLG